LEVTPAILVSVDPFGRLNDALKVRIADRHRVKGFSAAGPAGITGGDLGFPELAAQPGRIDGDRVTASVSGYATPAGGKLLRPCAGLTRGVGTGQFEPGGMVISHGAIVEV
jgi:hypothetical protein